MPSAVEECLSTGIAPDARLVASLSAPECALASDSVVVYIAEVSLRGSTREIDELIEREKLDEAIARENEGNLDGSIWHMERDFETNPANPAFNRSCAA
jgi:hypothetical protein